MNASAGPLDGRLHWSGRVPLQWRVLQRPPDPGERARTEERNTTLLNALDLIEEGTGHHQEEPSPMAAQLERLEAKFDLVITLLSEILLPEAIAPETVALRMSSRGVAFEAPERIASGTLVELSIHFSASLPRPVVLCGEVVQSAPGEERQLAVAFRDIGSAVNDHLERLVFRRHRRSIAQQRPLETA